VSLSPLNQLAKGYVRRGQGQRLLAEIEFVRLQTTGTTINGVLPTVPFYEKLYNDLGQYAQSNKKFNEPESLALMIVERLAAAPEKLDALNNKLARLPLFAAYFSKVPICLTRSLLILLRSNC
jgi:hypothetical protein